MKQLLKSLSAIVLAGTLLASSGCWDRQEIEERAFAMGVAVDLADEDRMDSESSKEQNKPVPPFTLGEPGAQKGALTKRPITYLVSYEIPVLRAMAASGGGSTGGGGGGGIQPSWVVGTTASTMQTASVAANLRLFRPIFYGHQRVLIIGEDAAREGLEPILDFFERDVRASRKIRVAIAVGRARDVLDITPLLEPLTSIYLFRLLQSMPFKSFGWDATLNDVMIALHQSGDAVISRLRASKMEADAGGAAVIKNWRLVGWLEDMETQGYSLALGRSRVGVVSIPIPGHISEELSYLYRRVQAQTKVNTQGELPSFDIGISLEGSITEETSFVEFSSDFIRWAEQALAEEITRRVRAAIDLLQKQYQVDSLNLGHQLEMANLQLWRKLSPDWDSIYPRLPINVKVRVKIRRTGSVR